MRKLQSPRRSRILNKAFSPYEIYLILILLFTVLIVTGYEYKLLHTHMLIKDMISEEIDYEAFREFEVSEASLLKAQTRIDHLIRKYPELQKLTYMDQVGYLTFSMMAGDYDLFQNKPVDEITFYRGIGRLALTESFQELYSYYKEVLTGLEYFPVPRVDSEDVSYADSWYGIRTYGGPRKHEGTDLMASNNLRGYFPVISMTDGFVEKIGWLEQGGNRIGIRSEAGGYFYYAHLYSYAPELKHGDKVIAGQILGFMGDSGYGSEGTIGQFDVHLHLGIYVSSNVLGTGEMSVNPFYLLKILEKNRTFYQPYQTD